MLQRNARVLAIRREWGRAQEVTLEVTAAPAGASSFLPPMSVRGLVLVDLVGKVHEGDEVRIDCSALDKRLGTGGYATVLATAHLPADDIVADGHIVKARYMPHQHIVQSVEEPDSPHHEVMANARGLDGVPVIVADLHSAVPAIVAGIRSVREDARIVYVWDDTAALPLAFSMAVSKMKEGGEVAATITSGQSFGGDIEAASMPSALLAARHVAHADYIVVAQGPGNLGTATRWGFSGTAVAQTLHVAHALGGTPLPVVRASQADQRPEHRGISHHSLSVLNELALIPLDIAVPSAVPGLPEDVAAALELGISQLASRHRIHSVDATECLDALQHTGVALRTMGRGVSEDALAFAAASAVGIYAAKLAARLL
ncbi:MAG: DUF3866 family protein [Actinomycetaceae bacterium]|nr:DUF3866 family protein [Actinomycetaceae bacterium]